MNHFMNNGMEYLRKQRNRTLLYFDEINPKKITWNALKDLERRKEKVEDYMYQMDGDMYCPAVPKIEYHNYCRSKGVPIEEKFL